MRSATSTHTCHAVWLCTAKNTVLRFTIQRCVQLWNATCFATACFRLRRCPPLFTAAFVTHTRSFRSPQAHCTEHWRCVALQLFPSPCAHCKCVCVARCVRISHDCCCCLHRVFSSKQKTCTLEFGSAHERDSNDRKTRNWMSKNN